MMMGEQWVMEVKLENWTAHVGENCERDDDQQPADEYFFPEDAMSGSPKLGNLKFDPGAV